MKQDGRLVTILDMWCHTVYTDAFNTTVFRIENSFPFAHTFASKSKEVTSSLTKISDSRKYNLNLDTNYWSFLLLLLSPSSGFRNFTILQDIYDVSLEHLSIQLAVQLVMWRLVTNEWVMARFRDGSWRWFVKVECHGQRRTGHKLQPQTFFGGGASLIISSSEGWRMISLYFLADGIRVSLVSISSSSEIFNTVVRYSMTRVKRSGRREISKMCSM